MLEIFARAMIVRDYHLGAGFTDDERIAFKSLKEPASTPLALKEDTLIRWRHLQEPLHDVVLTGSEQFGGALIAPVVRELLSKSHHEFLVQFLNLAYMSEGLTFYRPEDAANIRL